MKLVDVKTQTVVSLVITIPSGEQFLPDAIANTILGLNKGVELDYSKLNKTQVVEAIKGSQ